MSSLVEYVMIDTTAGNLYLRVEVNGKPYVRFGPFDTESERTRFYEDLIQTMRQMGARDVQGGMQ